MPKADYQLEGLDILFYSNDHEPAHIHVRRAGEWEIKVYFRLTTETYIEYDVKWTLKSVGPTARDLGRVREYVLQHRENLEREWETKVWRNQ